MIKIGDVVNIPDCYADSRFNPEIDKKTGEPLPVEGFIFAGSILKKAPDGSGKPRYVADVYDNRVRRPDYWSEPGDDDFFKFGKWSAF